MGCKAPAVSVCSTCAIPAISPMDSTVYVSDEWSEVVSIIGSSTYFPEDGIVVKGSVISNENTTKRFTSLRNFIAVHLLFFISCIFPLSSPIFKNFCFV
jgi:hypothetical protein